MSVVQLNVPYRSQWDDDAKEHSADCGPTCLAMILAAMGNPVTPDKLYTHIGKRSYSQYTSFGDLKKAADAHSRLAMTRKNFLPARAIDDLHASIDGGKPFVALVNYAFWDPIVKNNFRGAHFVLVTGYDDEHVYIHDPLFQGKRRAEGSYCKYTNKQFTAAWGGFAPNVNPNYAVLIAETNISHLKGVPVMAANAAPTPVDTPALDETVRRRILAKAAYDGQPGPNLNDAASVDSLTAALGDWGESWDTYTIRRGDSLANIARMFYHDGDKYWVIAYFNDLANPSLIEPGDVLLVPRPVLDEMGDATVALPGYGGPLGK